MSKRVNFSRYAKFLLLSLCLFPQKGHAIGLGEGVRVGASVFKTVAGLWADRVNLTDAKAAKRAAAVKLLTRIADAADRGLSKRSDLSKGLFVNAEFWQIAKDIQELRTLQELEEEHGTTLPPSALKEYYSAAQLEGDGYDEMDFEEIFHKENSSWKSRIKSLVRVTRLALSLGRIVGDLDDEYELCAGVGETTCDLILRYICNDKEFRPNSKIGKMEATSTLVAHLYDLLESVANSQTVKEMLEGSGMTSEDLSTASGYEDEDGDPSRINFCSVCLKNRRDMVKNLLGGCKHALCRACYHRVLKAGHKSCPTCRADLGKVPKERHRNVLNMDW